MAASNTPTSISSAKTVAAAGTAEALASVSLRVKSLTVVAKTSNTGQVYVGGSDVASTTNGGISAGASIFFEVVNWMDLADVYVNADVSGEGVDFYAIKA